MKLPILALTALISTSAFAAQYDCQTNVFFEIAPNEITSTSVTQKTFDTKSCLALAQSHFTPCAPHSCYPTVKVEFSYDDGKFLTNGTIQYAPHAGRPE